MTFLAVLSARVKNTLHSRKVGLLDGKVSDSVHEHFVVDSCEHFFPTAFDSHDFSGEPIGMWQDRQTLTHDRLSAHRCPLSCRHFRCYRIQLATSLLPLFSFMEKYDPAWSPNEADSALRYTFRKQPDISAWNCERLTEAFSSLVGE